MLPKSRRWLLRMSRAFFGLSAFCLLLLLSPACSELQALDEGSTNTLGSATEADNQAYASPLSTSVTVHTESREASFESVVTEKETATGYDFTGIATEPYQEAHNLEDPVNLLCCHQGQARKSRVNALLGRSVTFVLLVVATFLAVRLGLSRQPELLKQDQLPGRFDSFVAAAEQLALSIGTAECRSYANHLRQTCLEIIKAEEEVAKAEAALQSASGIFRIGMRQGTKEKLEQAVEEAKTNLDVHAADANRLVAHLMQEAGRQASLARQDLCDFYGVEEQAMQFSSHSDKEGSMLQAASVSLLSASNISKLEAHMGTLLSSRVLSLEAKHRVLQQELDASPELIQEAETLEKQQKLMTDAAKYLSPLSSVVKSRAHTVAFTGRISNFGLESLKSSFVTRIATKVDFLRQARDILAAYSLLLRKPKKGKDEIPYIEEPVSEGEGPDPVAEQLIADSERVTRSLQQIQERLLHLSTAPTVHEALMIYDDTMRTVDLVWSATTPLTDQLQKLQKEGKLSSEPKALKEAMAHRKESLQQLFDETLVQCENVREIVKTVYAFLGRLKKVQQDPSAPPIVATTLFQTLVSRAVEIEKNADFIEELATKKYEAIESSRSFAEVEEAAEALHDNSRAALKARLLAEEVAHCYFHAMLLENEVKGTANKRPWPPIKKPRTTVEKVVSKSDAIQAKVIRAEKNAEEATNLAGLASAVASLKSNSLMLEGGSADETLFLYKNKF